MILRKQKEMNNKWFIRIISIFIMIIGLCVTILCSIYIQDQKTISNLEKEFASICLNSGKNELEKQMIFLKSQTKNEKLNVFFQKSLDNCTTLK